MVTFTHSIPVKTKTFLAFFIFFFAVLFQSQAQTYCVSAATSTADDEIFNVSIGILNNSSTCSTTGGAGSTLSMYSDYTTLVAAPSLVQSTAYTLSVTVGMCATGAYSGTVIAFIDFNKDGDFLDAGETIYTSPYTAFSLAGNAVSSTITIPAGAPSGPTRMRIVEVETSGVPTSCGTYTWGETEDYSVYIGTPPAYDIAFNSIIAPSSWAVGNNSVTVKASNFGSTSLTSADFGYSVNGGTPVSQNVTFSTLAYGQSYNHTFSTALNIPSAGSYNLKIWVRNPNGVGNDGNTANDTLYKSICTGISGAFTINPSGSGSTNYLSFTAAAADLNNCGVSGPVTFTVSPGTYTEKFTLNNVLGTSSVNTITFDGVDSSNRTLTYNETVAVSGVINLIGTSYVTIKNLKIINTGTTYGSGINMQNGSNYNTILKCNVSVLSNATTSNIYGIGICGATYSAASTGTYNAIKNCTITGGYVGVSLYGPSNANPANGNDIIGCIISKAYQYGIYDYYQSLNKITDNRITLASATSNSGIYSYYCAGYTIDRNIIIAGYAGVWLYYGNNTVNTGRFSFSNNIINLNGAIPYSSNYGVYFYYNINGDFLHNTIYTAPTATGYYALYLVAGSNTTVKNNIFHSNNAGIYAIYCSTIPTAPFQCDYNIIYSVGTNYVYWLAAYADLNALKAATPLYNQNSISKVANFASLVNQAEDLHLSSASPSDVAELASALTVDVDNETRCALAPSIGADDSKYGAGTVFANYTTPDSVFVNSPTYFTNYVSPSIPATKAWYVNGTLVNTSHDLINTFPTAGTYTLKLKMTGCFDKDSMSKTIIVYNLTQKPIANFIADKNNITTNQNVSFKDLSSKGPSYFNWSVTPTIGITFVNGTTSNSQNPVINFAFAGAYTICLWDSNALGKSTSMCKTSYILVKATTILCTAPFDTKVNSGNLYDNGGPTGNYTINKTCSFLIDPCASSVSLNFSAFSLASGSYFRAYNGTDNLASKLFTGLGFTGTTIPSTLTASSGKMYIEFQAGATADKGFEATWTSVAGTFPLPTGSISAPDTVDNCGSLNTFTFINTLPSFNKDAADYSWYFGNPTLPQFSNKGVHTVQYGFTTAGVYPVRLEVNGCGGITTFYDTIRVIAINKAPTINFRSSHVVATISDVITLTDMSKYGTSARTWTITGPGTVTAITGTTTSSVYSFKLSAPGSYSAKLVGINCIGADSITVPFVTILNYCTPLVSNLNIDFAIENVAFGRIDTIINGEVKGFDYTNSVPALGSVAYRDNTDKVKTYSFGTKAVEAITNIGETYTVSVRRAGSLNSANTKIWVDYNQDGVFQTTELAAFSGAINNATFTGTITIPLNATSGITRMRIGTSVGLLANNPCGTNVYGDFNDYKIRITPDLTAPAITFVGTNPVLVEVGRVYTDPGYTVTDNITSPCPYTFTGIASGTQITTHPFASSYTVVATDGAGNTSTRTRFIQSTPDVTKPVITMLGTTPIYVEVGTSYTDAGATASDFYYGSLTSSIVTNSLVNTAVTGTYTVSYNVTDAAGNPSVTGVRTVIVRDTQKPVITVAGANPLTIEVFTPFTAPNATVTDNYCTGVSYTVTGAVNANVLGTYTLTYKATDCSGNAATAVVLTVIVRDSKAPTLLLIGGDTTLVDVNTLTQVPETGYSLNDNYYNQGALTLNVNYSNVKLNQVGIYPVRYYVSDPSFNMDSSKVRYYKVVDRIAPVISLTGASFIDWKRWAPYVDPGSTVTDNYYTSLSANVDASEVNIYLNGIYTVKYNVTDPSGNKAIELLRYVRVYTAPSGINTDSKNDIFSVYPNPNNGIFNFDIKMTDVTFINIVIFDANGKVVYTNNSDINMNNKLQIDLSKEAQGVYFIKVVTNNFTSSKTFSIQK